MLTLSNFTESPVEITSPLKNIDALEKDTVTFSCELSKPNVANGKWTFNGEEMSTREKTVIAIDSRTHTLVIDNVALEQQGQYSFSIGPASTEGTLFVGGMRHCDVWLASLLSWLAYWLIRTDDYHLFLS